MRSHEHDNQAGCARCAMLEGQLQAAWAQIAELQRTVEQLRALLDDSRRLTAKLQARVDQLEQEGHRQAAPFRVEERKRKATKGKPGRKRGHKADWRQPPPEVDERVEVPLECCPHCGGPVHDVRPLTQIIEDIPPVAVYRWHLTTYRGRCPRCGAVCSRHPEQVSEASGAAGTHLGRRALGLAAALHNQFGLTMRKTTAVLAECFGLSLTPGGLSQALARIAEKLQVPFAELHEALRASPVAHADETGWWLNGASAWLWVFANRAMTLFTIGDRSQQVIRRVLGDDYLGVLTSDCLASYNPHPGVKSKCCAHHLKAISEAQAQAPDSAWLAEIRALIEAAMALHRVREVLDEQLDLAQYWRSVGHLERRLDALLAQPLSHAAEIAIDNRLSKQRPHLLTFLHRAGVDPTNNLAERQLRPAVIARKLSAGNKTAAGAHTFAVLTSLATTCGQQGHNFADFVAESLHLDRPPPALFAAE